MEEVYRNARNDLYYYLITLGLRSHQAQEVTQDAFLKLYVAMRDGEEIRNTRAWLFRVAHNLGLNVREKESRLHRLDAEDSIPAQSNQESPERSMIEKERRAALQHAMAGLSPQQRQCLYLRAEGLRYHEIAAAIGISSSSVGEFLRRGLSKLRKVVHG